MSRLIAKIGMFFLITLIGTASASMVNWFKLDSNEADKTVERNVYLREVDKNFVKKYGITYEENYTYFLRGDIETNLYRGEEFLSEKTMIDTVNVVLDKKIRKEPIQRLEPKYQKPRGPEKVK